MCYTFATEKKKKSEPISDLENLVRIILVWCGKQDWILAARRRSVSAVLKPHWGLIHYGFFKSVSRVYKKEARRFRRAFFCGAGNRTWTCMKLLSLEPESSASANSAIPAKNGGQGWIRTIEVCDGRFTVCSLWPLGNLPIIHFVPNGTWLLYHLYSVFVNNKFK